MSAAVIPFRVKIAALHRLCAPDRHRETLAEVQRRFGRLLAQRDEAHEDDITDGCPTALDGVRLALEGGTCAPQWRFQLVYGVELLCRYWGWQERNDQFSPIRWRELADLQKRLGRLMQPEPLQMLLYGRSPLPIGELPDIPAVGYLDRAECERFLAAFPKIETVALENDADRPALRQLQLWLANAVEIDQDLVAFTY